MSRSRETFNKKEVRNKKEKKRKDKEKKKLERQERKETGGPAEDMFVYVDENGMLSSTPPDPTKKTKVELEDIEISIPKSDPNDKEDPVRIGTVTFFNDSKGFGFIRDNETKESVFLHINNMVDEVKEGNAVTFEIEKGPRGLSAVQVKLHKPA